MSEAAVDGSRGRLLHNEQFAPFYGSVAFENASNLHAGLCEAKSGRRGGSGARCFAASPLTMTFVQLVLKKNPMVHSRTGAQSQECGQHLTPMKYIELFVISS
jgi:hypothetical protein